MLISVTQRNHVPGLCLILLILIQACKTSQISKPNASSDALKQVFPKNRIVEIKLQIDTQKWDALRKQGKDLQSLSCEKTARIEYDNQDAQLWVDGEDYGKVKVKKKGFLGSQQQTKPSLKIKLENGK